MAILPGSEREGREAGADRTDVATTDDNSGTDKRAEQNTDEPAEEHGCTYSADKHTSAGRDSKPDKLAGWDQHQHQHTTDYDGGAGCDGHAYANGRDSGHSDGNSKTSEHRLYRDTGTRHRLDRILRDWGRVGAYRGDLGGVGGKSEA